MRILVAVSICLGFTAALDILNVGKLNLNFGAATLKGVYARRKRDAPDQSDGTTMIPLDNSDEDTCVTKCADDMNNKMDSLDTNSNTQVGSGLTLDDKIDTSALRDTCGAYKDGRTCIDGCPASDTKDLIVRGLAGMDFICISHYDEFISYLPCFNRTGDEISRTCDPKCGGTPDQLDALQVRIKMMALLGDLQGIVGVMSKLCSIISCQNSCEKPIILRVCQDVGASQFQSKFIQVSFKPLEELSTQLGGDIWPTECQALTKGA